MNDSNDPEKHRERHELLHRMFDELIADFIRHTGKGLQAPIMDLLLWSAEQAKNPTSEST